MYVCMHVDICMYVCTHACKHIHASTVQTFTHTKKCIPIQVDEYSDSPFPNPLPPLPLTYTHATYFRV